MDVLKRRAVRTKRLPWLSHIRAVGAAAGKPMTPPWLRRAALT